MTKAEEVLHALREPLCVCSHDKASHQTYTTTHGDVLDVWCDDCETDETERRSNDLEPSEDACGGSYQPFVMEEA